MHNWRSPQSARRRRKEVQHHSVDLAAFCRTRELDRRSELVQPSSLREGSRTPGQSGKVRNHVINGMRTFANEPNADIGTFAKPVGGNIVKPTAPRRKEETFSALSCNPRYTRNLLWGSGDEDIGLTAKYSLYASPVPGPPASEFQNFDTLTTIHEFSHLFKIVTPINVDRFGFLLRDHPNRHFVDSVLRGLRDGFWPCADTHADEYPITRDFGNYPLKSEKGQKRKCWLSAQCQGRGTPHRAAALSKAAKMAANRASSSRRQLAS